MDIITCYPTDTLTAPQTPPNWAFKGVFGRHHCYIISETIKFLDDVRTNKHPKRTASPTLPPTIPPSLIADIQQVVREMYSPPPSAHTQEEGIIKIIIFLIIIALGFYILQCIYCFRNGDRGEAAAVKKVDV